MAQLQVLFDANREIAIIVDLETWQAHGPALPSPNGELILSAFIDQTPFDVSVMDDNALRLAIMQFLDIFGPGPQAPADAGDLVASSDVGAEPVGSGDGIAERAPYGGPDHPGTQPADTDMEADTGPQTVKVRCWNCNGQGTIEFGDGVPPVTCNMCAGTGKVEQLVSAAP